MPRTNKKSDVQSLNKQLFTVKLYKNLLLGTQLETWKWKRQFYSGLRRF